MSISTRGEQYSFHLTHSNAYSVVRGFPEDVKHDVRQAGKYVIDPFVCFPKVNQSAESWQLLTGLWKRSKAVALSEDGITKRGMLIRFIKLPSACEKLLKL